MNSPTARADFIETPAVHTAADVDVPARATLRVASVCTLFPTDNEPHKGIFVARRVAELAKLADVKAIQPLPWFPFLRPQSQVGWSRDHSFRVWRRKMFYLPGAMKTLDGQWLYRSVFPVLRQWRDESGLDLIDAHFGFPEGVGAIRAANELILPAFVTLRGNEHFYLTQPKIRSQLLDSLHACQGIVTVSHTLREEIVAAGIDSSKVRVISNAVNRTQFFPGDKNAARLALDLPAESPVIVAVGQLVSGKGHDVLIRAAEEVRKRNPDIILAIVGAPSYERDTPGKLRELIESRQMSDTVRLVGAQPPEKVVQWLHAADLFSLCTKREGCCNSVLEAIACGVPVVTTDAGDNRRFVQPPANGYIVPFDDFIAVSSALEVAMDREWNPAQISDSLPQDGWEGVARAVLDFFHSRLEQNSSWGTLRLDRARRGPACHSAGTAKANG